MNETTRAYFGRLASIAPDRAARYRGLLEPSHAMSIEREIAADEPFHYSMLRTSVVPTMLTAGIGANVIPSEAEATLDIRMAPGEDPDQFFTEMARVIGDPAVKIVPAAPSVRPAGPPSGIGTDMFRALEAVSKRAYPDGVTLPYMLTAATDMAQLRARGIQSYGIGAETTAEEFRLHGPHSDVERIAPQSLHKLAEFTWQVVMEVSATRH
jgi:acetylornithine deacetylase/succinyl-diaminopimelate desuccinylase-like protein